MDIIDFFAGAKFASARAYDKYFTQPIRARRWAKKSAAFVHRTHLGHIFELDPSEFVDQHIFHHGIYERRFLELIAKGFPKGSVALDIGANIGNHSIYLASNFASIHAFEPNPNVLSRLRKNIELNQLSNIVVHPIGLGNASATLPFRENNDGNLGASGFLKPGEVLAARSSQLELRIENADDYVSALGLDRIDFIKVDVEGWEPQLFEGMAGTIAKHRPTIAFEHHGGEVAEGDYNRIIATLPGYVIFDAEYAPAHGSFVRKLTWNIEHKGQPALRPVGLPDARTYENLLAIPNECSMSVLRFGRFVLGS